MTTTHRGIVEKAAKSRLGDDATLGSSLKGTNEAYFCILGKDNFTAHLVIDHADGIVSMLYQGGEPFDSEHLPSDIAKELSTPEKSYTSRALVSKPDRFPDFRG